MSRNRQVAGDTVAIRWGGSARGRVRDGVRRGGNAGDGAGRAGGHPWGAVRAARGFSIARFGRRAVSCARGKPPPDDKTFRTGEGSESSRPNWEPSCAPDPGRGDARTHLYTRYPPGASSPARGARCPSSRTAPASSGRRASASERGWDGCAFSHARWDNFQGSRGNGTSATPSSRVARVDGGENARANAP